MMINDPIKLNNPSLLQAIAKNIILKQFSCLSIGKLLVELPSGLAKSYGDPASDFSAHIKIHDYNFFTRLLFKQEIGLGESFTFNEWTSNDVQQVLSLLTKNLDHFNNNNPRVFKLFKPILVLQHFFNRNTKSNSKKNINKHYDLSNDFFKLFLDKTMMYSCAFYKNSNTTLYEAQKEKMQQIIKKADLKPEHHLLEVGSGWGAMAIEVAQTIGCKVTTVTVSKEQYAYVKQQISNLKLEDKITVLFKDYRTIKGSFDRIISIEMIEAVGHKFLPIYFKKLNQLLKTSGKIVIQAITIKDDAYNRYSKGTDWIRKYIFPGGHLPSVGYIKELIKPIQLQINQLDDISTHYIQTLEDWKTALLSQVEQVKSLGFDDNFIRKWVYYFSYSQAGFSTKHIQDYHIVLSKQ